MTSGLGRFRLAGFNIDNDTSSKMAVGIFGPVFIKI